MNEIKTVNLESAEEEFIEETSEDEEIITRDEEGKSSGQTTLF